MFKIVLSNMFSRFNDISQSCKRIIFSESQSFSLFKVNFLHNSSALTERKANKALISQFN
jgi:hypothetical protein